MIVVDSSVWITHIRNADTKPRRQLQDIMRVRSGEIIVGDLILLEILQGARDSNHARHIELYLSAFQVMQMFDIRMASTAARNYRLLRQRGVRIRKTIDVIIGTFCVEGGHSLLQHDRDFEPMRQHLGLQTI